MKILSINEDKFRMQQKQVNVLANEAIHSMLKLIDPNMIKQTKTEDIKEGNRSLNAECWRYIYYLGFWKKLIYIMDTHTSLQLCFSVCDFENFKTVYLINYRPELSNDEMKEILQDSTKPWVKQDNNGIVKYLCDKVNLEICASEEKANYQIALNEACNCNLNANKFLMCKSKGDLENGHQYLFEAIHQAYEKFHKFCVARQKTEFRENHIDYAENLELYDIFFFYGRILKEKHLREGVKEVLSNTKTNHMAVNYIFKIIDFLINFIDDPNTYSEMITQNESYIILQAIFSPQNARIPENSKMHLNTMTSMLIRR